MDNENPHLKHRKRKVILDSDEDEGYPQFISTNNVVKTTNNSREITKIPPSYLQSQSSITKTETRFEKTTVQVTTTSSTTIRKITKDEKYQKIEKISHKSGSKESLLRKRLPEKVSPNVKIPRPSKLKKYKKANGSFSGINEKRKSRTVSRKSPKKLPAKPTVFEKEYIFDVPKTRHSLVYEILKRWWHCMPEWPPADENYEQKLAENNLREVTVEEFRISEELDSDQKRKVHQIPGYVGMFRNSDGEIIDLRDKSTCPCFKNLNKFPPKKLANMLVKALSGQIEELKTVPNYDQDLEVALESFKKRVMKAYRKYLTQG